MVSVSSSSRKRASRRLESSAAILRKNADADAARDPLFTSADRHGRREIRDDALDHGYQGIFVDNGIDEQRKFIAAETGHRVL